MRRPSPWQVLTEAGHPAHLRPPSSRLSLRQSPPSGPLPSRLPFLSLHLSLLPSLSLSFSLLLVFVLFHLLFLSVSCFYFHLLPPSRSQSCNVTIFQLITWSDAKKAVLAKYKSEEGLEAEIEKKKRAVIPQNLFTTSFPQQYTITPSPPTT